MATTSQGPDGQWYLTIHHNKPELPVPIPAVIKYNDESIQLPPYSINNPGIGSSDNVEPYKLDGWQTPLTEEGVLDANKISVTGQKTYNGKTYIITGSSFTVIPYTGETGTTEFRLSISQKTANITSAGTTALTAEWGEYSGNTLVHPTSTVTSDAIWETSDSSIATVNNGVVTGKNQDTGSSHTVTITVRYSGKSDTCLVTVAKASGSTPTVPELEISGSSKTMVATGGQITLSVSSNTGWTLSLNPAAAGYARISNSTGTGNATRTLTIDQNNGQSQRTVTVTAESTGDNQITRTWQVTQEKSGSTEPTLSISADPASVPATGGNSTIIISSNSAWTIAVASTSSSYATLSTTAGTNDGTSILTVEENTGEPRTIRINAYFSGSSTVKSYTTVQQNAVSPTPEYTLLVTIADGYSSTIDACGTTKVIATLYDGLGGSSAVTDSCDWLIITGAGYINIDASTNPVTVTGRGNATSREQECKVMARYNNTLTAATSIFVLQNPETPPFISLVDESDLTHFQNIPCLGLASPGYEIGISSNVAWRARLSDIDDEYWLHVSYNANTVTVYIDENVDPYSGEGGSARTSSFIIEAVDSSLSVSPITITVNQASCSDRINVPDKDAFVFDCNSPSSYTRNIVAWDDVEWHIEADFRAYQDIDWFSVSPSSGRGNGQFTVTILKDNFDKEIRGSGYVVFKTGSTQTPVDWDINVRQEPTPFFEITGNVAHVPATSGSVTVTVETNKEIRAICTDTWIRNLQVGNNVRQVGGTAYTEVTFDVTENSSEDSGRTGTITIQSLYSGDCGSLGSKTIQVIQDAAASTSASFIHVRKIDEPVTAVHQSISFPISEALASTTEMWFVLSADGDCKLDDITSSTGDESLLGVYMVNGNIDVDVTNGAPFSLIGSETFKAVYDTPYAREKNFELTFKTKKGTGSNKTATVEIQQEREYEIGVTNVYIDYVAPAVSPWSGNCCDWLLTTMYVQIYAERLFNSGRHGAPEQICNYIKTDPQDNTRAGVDEDMLTLTVLNNPSTGTKWCYLLEDELHGGNYHAECSNPFRIQFSPNSGNTAGGAARNVQFKLDYHDKDDNSATTAFTVTVPYCYIAPGTQDVHLVDGGEEVDEMTLNPGVDTTVTIQVTGLTSGETRLSFDCDESITSSILTDFKVQNVSFDASNPLNEWTADSDSAIISFTRKSRYEFRFDIMCNRTGYEEKVLNVWFDEWE